MNFKGRLIQDLTLAELNSADWELGAQEYKFNEAMKHPKFEKIKPVPTIGASFVALREAIKKEMEKKNG